VKVEEDPTAKRRLLSGSLLFAALSRTGTTAHFLNIRGSHRGTVSLGRRDQMSIKSILIVERDLVLRNVLVHFLQNYGYRIVEAASAEEAYRALSADQAPIDIALIDLQQPHQAAFGLAYWLRTNHPETDVLLAATAARALEQAGKLCHRSMQ
jgi:CheY-like chemotaxis protein